MGIGWGQLTFEPDEETLATFRSSWSWLLREPYTPLLFSTLGDVFLESEGGAVYWLNTGVGSLSRVADSAQQFRSLLGTDRANDWFLPSLIQELRQAGKHLRAGACYSFVILPIFAEGKYEVSNLNPISAREHFNLTGNIHRQLHSAPDGTRVRLHVQDET